MTDEKKLLGVIGLCRAAGKAVIGVPMICEMLAGGKSAGAIVIEASDTSDNTHKKITDKCTYYKARHVRINATCEALGRAVGKSTVAAVATADENFCRAIQSKLS